VSGPVGDGGQPVRADHDPGLGDLLPPRPGTGPVWGPSSALSFIAWHTMIYHDLSCMLLAKNKLDKISLLEPLPESQSFCQDPSQPGSQAWGRLGAPLNDSSYRNISQHSMTSSAPHVPRAKKNEPSKILNGATPGRQSFDIPSY